METNHQVDLLGRLGTVASGRVFGCLLALLLLGPAELWAHPSHSSYAEVEWSDGGTLDVALKVIPEDLERALATEARRSMVLVDAPEVRAVLAAYLARHFSLSVEGVSKGGGDAHSEHALELVGMELDYRDTWIYFSITSPLLSPQVPTTETPRDVPDAPLRLRNTLLMDVEPGQTNRVRRLWAPEAPVLVFSVTEPQRDLMVLTSEQ